MLPMFFLRSPNPTSNVSSLKWDLRGVAVLDRRTPGVCRGRAVRGQHGSLMGPGTGCLVIVAQLYAKEVFPHYGVPKKLISDRGPHPV
jgi:hypothetical protein